MNILETEDNWNEISCYKFSFLTDPIKKDSFQLFNYIRISPFRNPNRIYIDFDCEDSTESLKITY